MSKKKGDILASHKEANKERSGYYKMRKDQTVTKMSVKENLALCLYMLVQLVFFLNGKSTGQAHGLHC